MTFDQTPPSPPRSWVEINTAALAHNLRVSREASGCAIMAVVKAGAYGHGLEAIARFLESEGVEFLGVANIGEARRIRRAGVNSPIYLLGATWELEREEIVARNVTPCISTLAEAQAFSEIASRRGVTLPVHIAIDTGMARGGFLPSEVAASLTEIEKLPALSIEGIASHLSSSDEDEVFTNTQIKLFTETGAKLGGASRFRWIHLSNSGGILAYPAGLCNLARPGLMLYGISPIPQFQGKLQNVMSLKSRVSLARTVPAGHSVSYGRTYITDRPTRLATVGIGYGDGYPRSLSGKNAEVFIRSQRHPIVGRVTMDQIVVALPDDSPITSGDEVELFGANIPADEIAHLADTIAWELFTGITPRVERIYQGKTSL